MGAGTAAKEIRQRKYESRIRIRRKRLPHANGKRLGFTDYNGFPYYYIYNAMGDVIGMYDQYGDVIYYHYDSWSKLVSITNVLGEEITYGSFQFNIARENPFRYRGYMYDNTTQLYYLNSRYYDPETGRFVNSDGMTSTGEGISSSNMYLYCQNNPVNFNDPSGFRRMVSIGSSNNDVRVAQKLLNESGYTDQNGCKLNEDGIFGPKTDYATRQFQRAHGLSVDGIIGPNTWGALEKDKSNSTLLSQATTAMNAIKTTIAAIPADLTARGSVMLSGYAYATVTPFAIWSHWQNPYLQTNQKWTMTFYELGVAAGGVLMTYAIINFWNPTGWIAAAATVIYAFATMVGGNLLVQYYERKNGYL